MQKELTQLKATMTRASLPQEWSESLTSLTGHLSGLGVKGLSLWLSELKRALSGREAYEAYLDIWVQGWYAYVFAHHGLAVTMNPGRARGPDLLLADGQDAYVEVRRIRGDDKQDLKVLDEVQDELIAYGDPERDSKKVHGAVVGKARQGKMIPTNAAYLVAIRSDDEAIEEVEFQDTVQELEKEAKQGGSDYAEISGVVYYYGLVKARTGRCFYFWWNPHVWPQRRLRSPLANLLNSLRMPPC